MFDMIFSLRAEVSVPERKFKENTVNDYGSGILRVVKFRER
jgi:hypothetical protein